jgi:hypothetical protein
VAAVVDADVAVVAVVFAEGVESKTAVVVEVGATGAGGGGVDFSCGLGDTLSILKFMEQKRETYRAICAQDNLLVAGVFDFAVFNFGFCCV